MNPPKLPPNEPERLASLRSLNVLDTPVEDRFDRITRLAARLFDVPIALVSLVDENRQWFKSRQGLTVCETGRDESFCGHAILGSEPFVIEDATTDPRFATNPLVTDGPLIRFYAGHPLTDAEGRRLGTLCVIDTRPRSLTALDLAALRDLAQLAQTELLAGPRRNQRAGSPPHAARIKSVDPVTGLWTQEVITELMQSGVVRARERGLPCSVFLAEVVSGADGQAAAQVRAEVAQVLRSRVPADDAVGVWGSDRFLITLIDCAQIVGDTLGRDLQAAVRDHPVLADLGTKLRLGAARLEPGEAFEPDELIRLAAGALERAGAGDAA
jgi:GGDEF domain-containing protein